MCKLLVPSFVTRGLMDVVAEQSLLLLFSPKEGTPILACSPDYDNFNTFRGGIL